MYTYLTFDFFPSDNTQVIQTVTRVRDWRTHCNKFYNGYNLSLLYYLQILGIESSFLVQYDNIKMLSLRTYTIYTNGHVSCTYSLIITVIDSSKFFFSCSSKYSHSKWSQSKTTCTVYDYIFLKMLFSTY